MYSLAVDSPSGRALSWSSKVDRREAVRWFGGGAAESDVRLDDLESMVRRAGACYRGSRREGISSLADWKMSRFRRAFSNGVPGFGTATWPNLLKFAKKSGSAASRMIAGEA